MGVACVFTSAILDSYVFKSIDIACIHTWQIHESDKKFVLQKAGGLDRQNIIGVPIVGGSLYNTPCDFCKSNPHHEDFVLFDLILYVPSTIFQLYRDGYSWVETVLS